jgi:DNA-binding XRE family transcriptional regulator
MRRTRSGTECHDRRRYDHSGPSQVSEDLIDARDHSRAMRDIVSGAIATLTDAEVDAYLAAPTPLAFWRRHRGLTQAALAARVGIAKASLAKAETGRRGLKVETYGRLAKALQTRIEDLLAED